MRHRRPLALLTPALLALLALLAACEDSSSSSGGNFAIEAGPGFEAGTSPVPEAGPLPMPEAGTDAFVPPVILGVTVTVTDGVTPQNNVRVILHDATGAVTGQLKTDATGKVAIAVAPSMITVLTMQGSDPKLLTFVGVADGDHLTARVGAPGANPVALAPYSVTLTDNVVTTNATLYQVFTAGSGCYSSNNVNTAPISVLMFDYCLFGAKGAVLVRASNTGTTLGYAFGKELARPVAGGMAVDVAASAFTPQGSTIVVGTHIPVSQMQQTFARLGAIVDGAFFEADQSSGALEESGITFDTATNFAGAYQTMVARASNATPSRTVLVRRENTLAPASVTLPAFDFDTMLPLVQNVVVSALVTGRADVTITSAAATTSADAGVVTLTWFSTAVDSTLPWTFVVPPGTTALKIPALPADAPLFVPEGALNVRSAVFFDASELTDYAQAKALPFPVNDDVDLLKVQTPLPAAGTVRYTQYQPGG
jgi:hypothetical protein